VESVGVIEIVPQQAVVKSRGHDAGGALLYPAHELTGLEGFGEREGEIL
jgi:hypothetical protein